jgi:2-isopropylmalate synthase
VQEKLAIAKQLHSLGCDVIEAGFPIASPGDFHAVKTIAEEVGPLTEGRKHGAMTICGLSRAHEKDIETCFRALEPAPKRRIHTFLATSDIHLEHKLKISRAECITASAKAVAFAKSFTDDVEFSPEDAGRSDREFLVDVLGAVIEAGATTLNIPDTVGYCLPEEYAEMIEYLVKNVEGAENVVFSTHCHNDLGVATANTLEAVRRGARQAEVTINGIGERAGNTSLEEVVMAINTRPQWFPVYHDIDTRQIMRTSRMVSGYTGMMVQPNKAITGANAFAHEAGIHQDGVLKHQNTYEIMTPESVGLGEESNLVLGKHSGKVRCSFLLLAFLILCTHLFFCLLVFLFYLLQAAFAARLVELGHTELTQEQINNFTKKFKDIADEKKVRGAPASRVSPHASSLRARSPLAARCSALARVVLPPSPSRRCFAGDFAGDCWVPATTEYAPRSFVSHP